MADDLPTTIPCPRCGRTLHANPTTVIAGADRSVMNIFQCDHCTTDWDFGGETFECALTIAVDSTGKIFDSRTNEPMN